MLGSILGFPSFLGDYHEGLAAGESNLAGHGEWQHACGPFVAAAG